jgi:hypothetical protein
MLHHTLEVRRRRLGVGLTVAVGSWAFVAVSGCFVYVPASIDTVPVGSHVRVVLPPGASSQSDRGARGGEETISGTLLRAEAQDLVLRVKSGRAGPAVRFESLYREVTLATQDVTHVEVKRLHALRTGAAFAALASGFTVLILTARGEPGTDEGTPPNGIDEHLGAWMLRGRSLRRP